MAEGIPGGFGADQHVLEIKIPDIQSGIFLFFMLYNAVGKY